MAKDKANARVSAQTTINDELISKSKEVFIPTDLEGCIAEYGEAPCVEMIVNQKVLAIQADIRREIKVESGAISGDAKARKGLERF